MGELAKAREKLRVYKDLWNYHRSQTREFAGHDFDNFQAIRNRYEKNTGQPLTGKRILDLGCGQRYPHLLLLSAGGNEVTGIDLEVVGPGYKKYLKMLRLSGWERSLKSFLRQLCFDRLYFAELSRLSDRALDRVNLNIIQGDATSLPFPDDHFDLIVSTAVFEHITDLPKAAQEVSRVLKPGGVCDIEIHLFTSISGGHNLTWHDPDGNPSRTVPAWDHLRKNLFPAHVYLNRLRESQYRNIFSRYIAILDWVSLKFEGEKFLTPEIEKELAHFYREELLKKNIVVVGQKPPAISKTEQKTAANRAGLL